MRRAFYLLSMLLRFCGETEISPEMKSEIFSHSPHYFIIGVEFK